MAVLEASRASRTSTLWTAVGVTLFVACEGAGLPESRISVRDSAGIRIVQARSEVRSQAPWTLTEQPVWSVGELEGDPAYLLSEVTGAMQLPTGEIVIDGTFVEKTTLRTPAGVTPYQLACDAHGHVLMLGWGRDATEGPTEGFYQAHDNLLVTTLDGTIEADLGRWLASERLGNRGGSGPHPAGRATVFALHDDRVFVGSGELFEVEIHGLDGSLLGLLRGPQIPLEVTDSVKDHVLQTILEQRPRERHAEIRSDFAEWEWPESFPAFTALRVDSEDVVWLIYRGVSSPKPAGIPAIVV